jgi:hypothetical protein
MIAELAVTSGLGSSLDLMVWFGMVWMGYGTWRSLCGNFVILCAPFVDHTL